MDTFFSSRFKCIKEEEFFVLRLKNLLCLISIFLSGQVALSGGMNSETVYGGGRGRGGGYYRGRGRG